MARERALLARENRIAASTLRSDDPQEHKRTLSKLKTDGRQEEWRVYVVERLDLALEAKFTQNQEARQFLMETHQRTIGEASVGNFWGIGLPLSDHRVFNTGIWSNNCLGKALMRIRDLIQ